MSKNRSILLLCIAVLVAALGGTTAKFFWTVHSADETVSGWRFGNQRWSGTMTITGDTTIIGSLTIAPGTTIRFAVGDDQHTGEEIAPDGYNDRDPTRLQSWATSHAGLLVLRKLIARGTPTQRILFTSASPKPNYADWEALIFFGNRSAIEYATIEWSRNGINPAGNQPESILAHNIVRHTFWGAISANTATIQILDNELVDAGHEGIDIKSGSHIVRGNLISDCHAGIMVFGGDAIVENNTIRACGDGIGPEDNPRVESYRLKNTIEPASPDTTREWRYGNFAYQLFGEPTVDEKTP
jgi:hypothetical protein